MVSIYELLVKLRPLIDGYPWAEDALIDLWKMGAPDPSPNSQKCQGPHCALEVMKRNRCVPKFGCAMEKRVLLPSQFATWWADVAARQGHPLTAAEALGGSRELLIRLS